MTAPLLDLQFKIWLLASILTLSMILQNRLPWYFSLGPNTGFNMVRAPNTAFQESIIIVLQLGHVIERQSQKFKEEM